MIAKRYGMTQEELWHFDGGSGKANWSRVRGDVPATAQSGEVIVVPPADQQKLVGNSGPDMNTYVMPAIPTSAPPVIVTLELVDIAGLYKPEHDDGSQKASGYQKGYLSEDDKGRIFVNHIPRTDPAVDWQDTWKKDTQYIELEVELGIEGDKLPADLRVIWEWEDPDDPSNADMREDASAFVDPSDYEGDQRLGDMEDDNAGLCDHPGSAGPAFEQMAPYTLTPVPNTKTCETLVVDRFSKVRFHCTNVGGDNFKMKVDVKEHDQVIVYAGGAETGVMTMWKRIDVEYRKMDGAHDLPIDEVPPFFEKAFVQMDFSDPLPTPRKEFMSEKDDDHSKESSAYVTAPPTGVFEHESQPGWFLLVSALQAAKDVGTASAQQIYPSSGWGPATIVEFAYNSGGRGEGVAIPQTLPKGTQLGEVKIQEGNNHVTLTAHDFENDWPEKGHCTIYISPMDYQSDFFPGTGASEGTPASPGSYDIRHLYYPTHMATEPDEKWIAGGLGFRDSVDVQVMSPGSIATGGVSPFIKHKGKKHFAGRTIIYTHHRKMINNDADARLLMKTVIVHEFGHAFGFPHKCGYYTWQDPAEYSCAMNYTRTWLYHPETGTMHTMRDGETLKSVAQDNKLESGDIIYNNPRNAALRRKRTSPLDVQAGDQVWIPTPRTLQRFEVGRIGFEFCARHLDGMRKVHLEDNPAMWRT